MTTLTQLTRYFLPEMIERRRGRVLNVASTAGFCPGPGMSLYSATKAYVVSLSQGLFLETRGTGVVSAHLLIPLLTSCCLCCCAITAAGVLPVPGCHEHPIRGHCTQTALLCTLWSN